MKHIVDGFLFYVLRFVWRFFEMLSNSLFELVQVMFDWFSVRFGSYPDVDDKWF